MCLQSGMLNLEKLDRYYYDPLIQRFQRKFGIEYGRVQLIFEDLKKFFLLSYKYRNETFINHELLILDQMWHTFLLFTEEYGRFCISCFGEFIHHTPMTKIRKKNEGVPEGFNEEATRQFYSLIYDEFGEDVLVRWIKEYGSNYNKESLSPIAPLL